jgi:hypothetical protein
MLSYERRVTSKWLGSTPYVSFSLGWKEKATVIVLSKNGVLDSYESTAWDVDLTHNTRFIIVIRKLLRSQAIHVFEVVETYRGLDIKEIERMSSRKALVQWLKEQGYDIVV